MKVNLSSLSNRAQSFLKNPQFFKAGLLADFEVAVDKDDKILTVVHGEMTSELEFILASVVAKFSENKKILEVWKINFREIESFLRDENHLPAFTEELPEVERLLTQIKIAVIAFAVKAKLGESLPLLISQRKNWNQLDLPAKNLWAKNLLDALSWELVMCEGDVLTVTGTPTNVDEEAETLLINTIFKGEDQLLPMKVVAV